MVIDSDDFMEATTAQLLQERSLGDQQDALTERTSLLLDAAAQLAITIAHARGDSVVEPLVLAERKAACPSPDVPNEALLTEFESYLLPGAKAVVDGVFKAMSVRIPQTYYQRQMRRGR